MQYPLADRDIPTSTICTTLVETMSLSKYTNCNSIMKSKVVRVQHLNTNLNKLIIK